MSNYPCGVTNKHAHFNSEDQLKECDLCFGSGNDADDDLEATDCVLCEGTGLVLNEEDEDNYEKE